MEKISNRILPIQVVYLEIYFAEKKFNLTATLDATAAYKDAEFVVIAAKPVTIQLRTPLISTILRM